MDRTGVSRREVLASLGGIGVAGAVSGAGTYALLSDDASSGGTISAGTLTVSGGNGRELSFSVRNIDRGGDGDRQLGVVVDTNPAWLWLGSDDCPPVADPLGDALLVTLRWDGTPVASGTLSSVRRSLRGGVLLGGSCTTPGKTIELELVWELPEDAPDGAAHKETAVEFRLVAEQCRHNGDPQNPFAGATPCDEPPTDDRCVPCPRGDEERIASASFRYDGPETATVELLQRQSRGSPRTDYAFADLEPGDTFTTDLPGSGRPDIDVALDGEVVGDFHISCSKPFGPGLVVGDGTYSLTVLEATDKAGNTICEVEQ